jgi:hypothetical protein
MRELLVDVLCISGVIAFEFFSRCVVAVSYVDVSCVVSVAEDVELHWGAGCPVCFTCRLVLYFANTHYSILVIIHFNNENFGVYRDFFV